MELAGLGWQGWLTIGVVLATLGLLLRERLGPDRVLAGAVVVLVVTGVLEPAEALAGFWNPGVLTVALLFVLVAALRTTGAIRWLGAWVLGRTAREFPARLRLTAIASVLSAFINNTPIVATLASAVEHWARARGLSPSRFLLPMNYATVLGGMCTLIGTSTNLIVAGLVITSGMAPLGMFDPLPVALPAVVVGLAYLAVAGRWLLPERRGAIEQAAAEAREYAVEMVVEPAGRLVGRTVDQAGLRHLSGSYLVELVRGQELLTAVAPDTALRAGDRLVFVGVTNAVRELRRIEGLRPATEQLFKLDGAERRRNLVELVLSRFSPAVGKNLRESAFRNRYNAAVIAVSRHGRRLDQKPGDVVLQAGDTLLAETAPDFMARFGNSPDFLLVSLVDGERPVQPGKALATLAILAAMVLANTVFGLPILASAAAAALAVLLGRCVGLAELRRSLDLRLIAVIACSFALGAAMDRSGAAAAVAAELRGLGGSDPFLTLVLVYAMAVLFTEMLTNNAAAVLMFPIGLAAARQLGVDPMPFVMAVMIGASAGFITPIGYQTNLMVYGPGGYRFLDYVRLGAPLSLLVGVTVLWTIPRFWPF
ncbi:SLC13 family permease [Arenimonas fontis]|uniref:SLC13 family permease n=1 Tax=Arenimonas fontis TaxID=2608255 RepID=A0A5B2ZCQ4_9GAMM|nr:SLC13 family permease [Arenimonas fontis]KAA2285353.1 SLC13 family permease [Arenimonas fontis]